MKILFLPCNTPYFDKVQSGEIVSEYRYATKYWEKRLDKIQYDVVVLKKGYTSHTTDNLNNKSLFLFFNFQGFTRGRINNGEKILDVFWMPLEECDRIFKESIINSIIQKNQKKL